MEEVLRARVEVTKKKKMNGDLQRRKEKYYKVHIYPNKK